MKLKGIKPTSANTKIVVIPRGDGNDLVFKVQAVLDMEPFDKLCPAPIPPTIVRKDQSTALDVEDPKYKEKLTTWAKYKNAWMVIESLKATEDLEWETVDRSDPDTWDNYLDELKDFKLAVTEINIIMQAIAEVNGLDEDKIEEARKRFLASLEAKV